MLKKRLHLTVNLLTFREFLIEIFTVIAIFEHKFVLHEAFSEAFDST